MTVIKPSTNAGAAYQGLYRAGGVAAWIAALAFRRNMDAEYMLLRQAGLINTGPAVVPTTIGDWFALLQTHTLLGLTLLNLFDLVNYALMGLMLLALLAALWRVSRSWMAIAASLGFLGVAIYFASNQALALLSLSNQYAGATTDAQRGLLLGAGQALLAIHQNAGYTGSGIYLSFLLVSLAGLIISAVMLRSSLFGKTTAYTGILANGFGLAYYLVMVLAPAIVFVPLSISAVFLLVWYLLIGSRLWVLGLPGTARSRQVPIAGDLDLSSHEANVSQVRS
jgi:hypothetical protein